MNRTAPCTLCVVCVYVLTTTPDVYLMCILYPETPFSLSLSLSLSVFRYCNRMSVREAVQVGAVLGTVCVAGALYISRR